VVCVIFCTLQNSVPVTHLSKCSCLLSCTMCTGEGHELVFVHADQRLREQDLISFHHSDGNPARDQLVCYPLLFFADFFSHECSYQCCGSALISVSFNAKYGLWPGTRRNLSRIQDTGVKKQRIPETATLSAAQLCG
jgi:hypothetical protein